MPTCSRCGRELTNEASMLLGIGPECQAKAKAAEARNTPDGKYTGGDIICRRDLFGAHVNVPCTNKLYGQELEWNGGYGSDSLALNILLRFIPYRIALKLHQDFKRKFIVAMPYEGGTIKKTSIQKFLKGNGAKRVCSTMRSKPSPTQQMSKHRCAVCGKKLNVPKVGIPREHGFAMHTNGVITCYGECATKWRYRNLDKE